MASEATPNPRRCWLCLAGVRLESTAQAKQNSMAWEGAGGETSAVRDQAKQKKIVRKERVVRRGP